MPKKDADSTPKYKNSDDLNQLLDLHEAWLADHQTGKRAEFRNEKFVRNDLNGRDLSGAHFVNCEIEASCAKNAQFVQCMFHKCYISGVKFQNSDISKSRFTDSWINFSMFDNVDFTESSIENCKLSHLFFDGAKLDFKTFDPISFHLVNLKNALVPDCIRYRLSILPSSGPVIGWKKLSDGKTAELEITTLERSNATGRICRCKEAKVLNVYESQGLTDPLLANIGDPSIREHRSIEHKKEPTERIYGWRDDHLTFTVGQTTIAEDYIDDWRVDEGGGIYFYITRYEAEVS